MGDMRKEYKAVVVCFTFDKGVYFAKRSDSPEQTRNIIFSDIEEFMEGNSTVRLHDYRDEYDEWVLEVKAIDNEYSRHYKVCFNDDKEE